MMRVKESGASIRSMVVKLDLRGEARVEHTVGVARGQVVEDIEAPADVVGGRAEVRIELRYVSALGDDQLSLLSGLGVDRARQCLRQRAGEADGRRPFQ